MGKSSLLQELLPLGIDNLEETHKARFIAECDKTGGFLGGFRRLTLSRKGPVEVGDSGQGVLDIAEGVENRLTMVLKSFTVTRKGLVPVPFLPSESGDGEDDIGTDVPELAIALEEIRSVKGRVSAGCGQAEPRVIVGEIDPDLLGGSGKPSLGGRNIGSTAEEVGGDSGWDGGSSWGRCRGEREGGGVFADENGNGVLSSVRRWVRR